MSLKNKLKRLKESAPAAQKPSQPEADAIPFLDEWKKADTAVYRMEEGFCLIREKRFPLSHRQGRYTLAEAKKAINAWQSATVSHSLSAKGHRPQDLFFFDTETTGLSGVGNTIFMLGYARFTEQDVVVRQHILPGPGQEVPLYMSFLESVDYTTLVTYNGKSFDWPVVKSRHTLIKEHVPKLPSVGHFDLYHASRRMWKRSLQKVKLTEVEKHILDFHRVDDLPGYLAPAIYFDFIDRKNPEGMIKVIDHNEKDLLSLISLYAHLTFQLLGIDPEQSVDEKVDAGKWFLKEGDRSAASTLLEEAMNRDTVHSGAAFALAFEKKKLRLWDEAERLWRIAVQSDDLRQCYHSWIELAKLYEHQLKNGDQALSATGHAAGLLSSLFDGERLVAEQEQIEKRTARIERKYSLR